MYTDTHPRVLSSAVLTEDNHGLKSDISAFARTIGLEPGDIDYDDLSGLEMSVRYILSGGKAMESADHRNGHFLKLAGCMAKFIIKHLDDQAYLMCDVSRVKGGFRGFIYPGDVLKVKVSLRKCLPAKKGKTPHFFRCSISKNSEEVFAGVIQFDAYRNYTNELLKKLAKKLMRDMALS